ncbi:MAG TPA: glycosyltransferase family 4 protein [Acidimicrobiia bacterium]|nr:glycosyltransferase family 4 protein [Acidimicrobiia bacterium]
MKLRVLYWPRVFWPQIGGVERIAADFLPAMRQRGYEFAVITSHSSLPMPDEYEFQGAPVYRFHFWEALVERDPSRIFQIAERIAAIKRDFEPDLVHVNYWEPSLYFQHRTATAAPTPLLVSFRGPPPESGDTAETVFGRTMHTATWVTAVSTSVLQAVRAHVPEVTSRSSVIHNGIDLPPLQPTPLSFQPPRLLCIGRLVPEKGFDLALRALALLVRAFPSLRLTIAGDGPERPVLETLARELGVNAAVRFLGWVPPEQVPSLMNEATLVLVPSRWEGLPGVAIQASQMARPIVATDVWGIPEIVIDGVTGLLTESEDVPGLARGVDFLLRHPEEAAAFGKSARRHVEVAFNWQRYLDAHDSLYRTLTTEVGCADPADALAPQ